MAFAISISRERRVRTRLAALVLVAILASSAESQPRIDSVEPQPVIGDNGSQWLTIRGEGFTEPFNARLLSDGVDGRITDPRNLRFVGPEEVRVFTVFGTEAAPWSVTATGPDGVESDPFEFNVVAPRPVIEVAGVTGAYGQPRELIVLGPDLTRYTEVLWDGEPIATVPVQTSEFSSALTLGFRAQIPALLADPERSHTVQVRTPAPGGGLSEPYVIDAVPAPLRRQPAFWAVLALFGAAVLFAVYVFRSRRVRTEALEAAVEKRTRDLAEAVEVTQEQAQRLRSLDRQRRWFLAGSMHEMRTPLAVIRAALGRDGDATASEATLRLVRNNADRLLETLAELAELAELDLGARPFQTAPADLRALLRTSIQAVTPLAAVRDVEVRLTSGDARTVWADLDARAIRTIVGNVVGNAIRHTPHGGEVRVSSGTEGESGIWIAVEDDGPGVPETDRDHVFERFTQGGSPEAAVGRSGIGLALALELANLHGGTMQIDPENSARFVIRLPATLSELADNSADPAVAEGPLPVAETPREIGGDAPLVLVVDDEDDIRTLLVQDLSQEFRVEEVSDGAKALSEIRRLQPDLVLLDVMLPGRSGIEILTLLRQDPTVGDTPVVTVTARSDAGAPAYRANANGHVQKPWDREELVAQIQSLIATHRALKVPQGPPDDETDRRSRATTTFSSAS